MAKIITVAHQKGGVGKSTLALNLALCFSSQLSIAIVDTDPQGSLLHIREDISELAIIGVDDLNDMSKSSYDLIVVDTPPYLSSRLPELFRMSDLVLIPTKAGFFDLMAIRSTLEMVFEAKADAPNLKAGIVRNMIKPRSGINTEITEMLMAMQIPLLNTIIHDRVSIARTWVTSGVLNGKDRKAKDEITSLAEEVVGLVNS